MSVRWVEREGGEYGEVMRFDTGREEGRKKTVKWRVWKYGCKVPSKRASFPLKAAPGPEGRTGKVTATSCQMMNGRNMINERCEVNRGAVYGLWRRRGAVYGVWRRRGRPDEWKRWWANLSMHLFTLPFVCLPTYSTISFTFLSKCSVIYSWSQSVYMLNMIGASQAFAVNSKASYVFVCAYTWMRIYVCQIMCLFEISNCPVLLYN